MLCFQCKPQRHLAIFVLLLLLPGQSQADEVDFKRDVAPILEERCWYCHGEDEQESGLRLDLRANMLRGGNSGLSAVPKTPTSEASAFGSQKNRNPIDAFLLESLAEQELSFSEPTDPRSLIRRASIVLTGIAPTPEETTEFVDAFATDSEKAYAALVDRLFDSPHFGERWAQHWLDVIRWAETNGSEANLRQSGKRVPTGWMRSCKRSVLRSWVSRWVAPDVTITNSTRSRLRITIR